MTWGEFKKLVEDNGIRDGMEIEYIDIENPNFGDGYKGVQIDEINGYFCIYN